MAAKKKEPKWLEPLEFAIEELTEVRDQATEGRLHTASELLSAARRVEDAVNALEPSTSRFEIDTPSVTTGLVREARALPAGERPTWEAVAEALGLSMAQRAFDRHAPGGAARRQATRERVYAARTPHPRQELPGLSTAEAEAHFNASRTKVRSLVEQGLLHAYPHLNEDGTPVTVRRAGKDIVQLRYYTEGSTIEQAANALNVTPAEVKAMAAAGEIGSAPVLDAEHKPVIDSATGETVRWYWPEHTPVAAEE
ncbi:hypothetical protein [Arthrobacter sp. STN4]|uniref:hypothetical protein n=1 Tax=Arthrobacter sp. STN4 TaxID=2923276 RepID=UPI00211A9FDB|nr:hypothetical protein [Arthrobacter sp. STN4]MCQ9162927.1 hypothetical protein [Arthrobacter sp. STN4]